MPKFVLKFIVLSLPFILLLGYIEHRLSKMPNNYQVKKALFEQSLSEIEILSLGSSNSCVGINPAYLDLKGFNLGYRGQSYWYGTQITLHYLYKMPKLKIVLIPIDYLTFGTTLDDVPDKWRMFFYDQVYKIHPSHKSIMNSYGIYYWLDPRRFSLIALYGERTPGYILNHFDKFEENVGEKVESNGWFDVGDKPMDLFLKIWQGFGQNRGRAYNLLVNPERYLDNLRHIQLLIDELKKRNIIPVLLQLPDHKEIAEYWDKEKLLRLNQSLEIFARKNNIQNLNYMYDLRFNATDFINPNHLNRNGAKKFSLIINHDIILPILSHSLKK